MHVQVCVAKSCHTKKETPVTTKGNLMKRYNSLPFYKVHAHVNNFSHLVHYTSNNNIVSNNSGFFHTYFFVWFYEIR